jgi:site-specific DNA-methyltransferase (adenine-specific)
MFAARLLRPGGCCCVCCPGGARKIEILINWISILKRYLKLKEIVVWDKGGLGLGLHYRQNYEYVIVAMKAGAPCIWNGNSKMSNIARVNRIIPIFGQHPTPKPIELMENFIRLHSDPGDVVLDPFAGQGPTLVAAKKTGRKFLGIEIEANHCDAIARRLELEDAGNDTKSSHR